MSILNSIVVTSSNLRDDCKDTAVYSFNDKYFLLKLSTLQNDSHFLTISILGDAQNLFEESNMFCFTSKVTSNDSLRELFIPHEINLKELLTKSNVKIELAERGYPKQIYCENQKKLIMYSMQYFSITANTVLKLKYELENSVDNNVLDPLEIYQKIEEKVDEHQASVDKNQLNIELTKINENLSIFSEKMKEYVNSELLNIKENCTAISNKASSSYDSLKVRLDELQSKLESTISNLNNLNLEKASSFNQVTIDSSFLTLKPVDFRATESVSSLRGSQSTANFAGGNNQEIVVPKYEPEQTVYFHAFPITCLVEVDNSKYAVGDANGEITMRNKLDHSVLFSKVKGHNSAVRCMLVSYDDLVTGGSDNIIKVWKISKNFSLMRTIEAHKGRIWSLYKISESIISCGEDKKIKIWDSHFYQEILTLDGHEKTVTDLLEVNSSLLSVSIDQSIRIWSLETLSEIKKITENSPILCCSHAEINKAFAIGKENGEVCIIKNDNMTRTHCLRPHHYAVCKIINLRNNHICYSSKEGQIIIWDIEKRTYANCTGHEGSVFALTNLSSYEVLSGGEDCKLMIWK